MTAFWPLDSDQDPLDRRSKPFFNGRLDGELASFLDELRTSGALRVQRGPRDGEIYVSPAETGDEVAGERAPGVAERALRELEARGRTDLAARPPDFDVDVGLLAARCLLEACRLLVFRDAEDAEVARRLVLAVEPADVTTIYSVDVALRYLPALRRLAVREAPGDSLVVAIDGVAREWPLSSVGIADLEIRSSALDEILAHESLRMLYLDRIVEAGDTLRLDDPRVSAALDEALGERTDLGSGLSVLRAHGNSSDCSSRS